MSLKIAVQMDPIERINIKGDSTFALLLEAQRRGHKLAYYTPDRLALLNGRLFATVESLAVRDQAGDHFTLAAPGPALRPGLCDHHPLARAHPPQDAGGQRPRACAQRAGENVRYRVSRP